MPADHEMRDAIAWITQETRDICEHAMSKPAAQALIAGEFDDPDDLRDYLDGYVRDHVAKLLRLHPRGVLLLYREAVAETAAAIANARRAAP